MGDKMLFSHRPNRQNGLNVSSIPIPIVCSGWCDTYSFG